MTPPVFPVAQKPAALGGLGDSLAELLSVSVLISISLIVYESLWQGLYPNLQVDNTGLLHMGCHEGIEAEAMDLLSSICSSF
jgi:hypothetical protein